jgi:hypothetical protein
VSDPKPEVVVDPPVDGSNLVTDGWLCWGPPPKRYEFIPQKDITPWEVAMCLPLINAIGGLEEYIAKHGLQRHFQEV